MIVGATSHHDGIFACHTPFPRKDPCHHRRQQAYAGGHHRVCNNRARLLRRDPAKRVVSAYGTKLTKPLP